MRWFSQIVSITLLGLQTIPERKGSSLAAALGIAGVVAVLVGVLSIAMGFEQTMRSSGSPDTAASGFFYVHIRSSDPNSSTTSHVGKHRG